jgi:hypothetical protein
VKEDIERAVKKFHLAGRVPFSSPAVLMELAVSISSIPRNGQGG